jgi:hypothetical protein
MIPANRERVLLFSVQILNGPFKKRMHQFRSDLHQGNKDEGAPVQQRVR